MVAKILINILMFTYTKHTISVSLSEWRKSQSGQLKSRRIELTKVLAMKFMNTEQK